MRRKYGIILLFLMMMFLFPSCENRDIQKRKTVSRGSDIVILYDNDVHCAVDGYAKMVALRDEQLLKTKYVTTVSCGDFVSGDVVGAASEGKLIVDIINKAGYDVLTLGNHEFDYGMQRMFDLTESMNANVVCANLINCQTGIHVFPAYHIIEYGDVDVAYIGFTTTTSGTVKMLADESGVPLYSFMRDDFYRNAQYYIDEARDNGAEYVVALTHLGDTQDRVGHPTSTSLIANTTGLDAVIDGHAHHVIEEAFVNDKEGEPVLLTSSGFMFENVGMLTISADGTFSSELFDIRSDEAAADFEMQKFVDNIKEEVLMSGLDVIGISEVKLTIYDEEGRRVVRNEETNLGDFCADAFRVYTQSDVAMINAGALRADIGIGDVTYNDMLSVMPFNNLVCMATMNGRQLLDALEFSVAALPEESGAFMQVSGMRFDVNLDIPSPVVMDAENDMFSHIGDGERRVSNLQILDVADGTYHDVDLNHTYTIASLDYLVMDLGDFGILRYAQPIDKYVATDLETLIFYVEEILGGSIGDEYADVEGRINIKSNI